MTKEQEQILETLKKSFQTRNRIVSLEAEIEEKDCRIEKLESREIELMKKECDKKLDLGIGIVEYKSCNSLQLQQLMEALESAIKKHSPGFVLNVLETIS